MIITHHAYDDLVALAQPRSAQCISVLTCDAEACAAWETPSNADGSRHQCKIALAALGIEPEGDVSRPF
jgi:hypothetical protein